MIRFDTGLSSYFFLLAPLIFYIFVVYVGVKVLAFIKHKERIDQEIKNQLQELKSALKK
ncbi:hypothetical protein ACFSO0_19350 [Brevibacillus sp. GCM10020057]|uniref:hypothetical protein n=1 Tax=Brevibacillus sp. GCM10020057 TaxID=3317327 RepID=UPI00363FA95B